MFLTITAGMIVLFLGGCGDPKYQAPPIVVTFSTEYPPPAALATDATSGIAAIISNGPENANVTFTCAPIGKCGTFGPNPVASNVPTTYAAPAAIPAGDTVTVTATSVTDPTKFASATITID
jgi:hypothetical protein